MTTETYTNAQILDLIAKGKATYGMKVYSSDWKENLWFDGTVFIGFCSCQEIGTRPVCTTPGAYCFPPKSVTVEII